MTFKELEKQAELLYINFIDMDFLDYAETYEADLEYIKTLITRYGITKARDIINKSLEN